MRETLEQHAQPLVASRRECGLINLRGNVDDSAFSDGVQSVLGLALPGAGTFSQQGAQRLIWVGPDDWFSVSLPGTEKELLPGLSRLAAQTHCAATDVSGGYTLVTLSGPSARDILSAGCPLDLRADRFQPGAAAGSVFFKAAIRLWMTDNEPRYELLVRRSFEAYFWALLERSCQECGLQRQDMV
jgi:sarcosine oxidase subunit gamma